MEEQRSGVWRGVSGAPRAPIPTNMSSPVFGGCLCGASRFSVRPCAAQSPLYCHCSLCRRAHGATNGVAWFTVPAASFAWDATAALAGGGGSQLAHRQVHQSLGGEANHVA